MKVIHLCLSSFYIDNFGYQENLISEQNKRDGHDVTIIASRVSYDIKNGDSTFVESNEYINDFGIKVYRLDFRFNFLKKLRTKIKSYKGLNDILKIEKPDIIFSHGIQYLDLIKVSKYCRKNSIKLVSDTHAAYINSGKSFFSRNILHKIFYKYIIKRSIRSISRVYYVADMCKTFAIEMYGINVDKLYPLYLGADFTKIDFSKQFSIREKIRYQYSYKMSDIVLISGGKLTKEKRILELIDSFNKITDSNVKLLVFGSLSHDIQDDFIKKTELNPNINYIGWVKADDVYNLYFASDIAVFPGTKSALWEQAISCGLPLICKYYDGLEYIDGGNCIFLKRDSQDELKNSIEKLCENDELRNEMSKKALKMGYNLFSYENIAKKAIDIEENKDGIKK